MRSTSAVDKVLALDRRWDKYDRLHESLRAGGDAPFEGGLLETYHDCYPSYLPPDHLSGAVEVFERAEAGERVRAVVTLPRRAGKTELLLAVIAHRLRRDPSSRVTYATFGQDGANSRSDRARKHAARLGVPVDRSSRAKRNWRTGVGQGGLWATAPGGPVVGEGSDLLLLDDLFKGRTWVERQALRDSTWAWLQADAMGTLSPHASCIVTSTRWHEDDVSGRLIREGWEEVRVPALGDDGSSYWPEMWPVERLLEVRERLGGPDGYDWVSLYQGSPRPSGAAVFRGVTHWAERPLRSHMRVWVGVDPGYSLARAADPACAVVLGEFAGRCYVLDVVRVRAPQEEFARRVADLCRAWEPDGVVCYVARTEQNVRSLFRLAGVEVSLEFAVGGKDVHARPASYWWNSGRLLVPPAEGAPAWLEDLVSEVCGFPGRHDDQVDALAAAFLRLTGASLDWSSVDPGDGRPLSPSLDWDI